MPRISKRNNVVKQSKFISIPERKRYNVAIYIRLSVDADDKKNESIETQIDIISKYISDSSDDMQIYSIYRDLGKTGTNFERNEFDKMLQDIRLGDVNCVMVKDLSRFGRNYIEAGNYIERIFPFLGVRFIAVSDHFDTEDVNINDKTMGMNIKNLVNEMYAKDSSKRAQVQIRQRIEQGIYVGGVNPYGYYTTKGDRNRVLYPEKGTSDVIKAIFEEFSKNHNINGVVRMLAAMRANPATVYQKTGQVICPLDVPYKAWATESVKRILKNPIYLGILVQGKSSCIGRNEKNRKWFDEREWIISEHTHEPLVSKKVFDGIQEFFKEQEVLRIEKEKNKKLSVLKENVFHDVIICGCCGQPMQRIHHNESFSHGIHRKEVNAYSCEYAYSAGEDRCKSNRINESKISELLFALLSNEFHIYLNKKKDFIAYNTELANIKRVKYKKELTALKQKIQKAEQEVDRTYRIYRDGSITSDEFESIRLSKKRQTDKYQEAVIVMNQKILQMDRELEKQKKAIKSILNLKFNQVLTKEIVNTLVDKIIVYPGKKVEIKLAYTNELLNTLEAGGGGR